MVPTSKEPSTHSSLRLRYVVDVMARSVFVQQRLQLVTRLEAVSLTRTLKIRPKLVRLHSCLAVLQ